MAVRRMKKAFDDFLVRKYYLELYKRKKVAPNHRRGWSPMEVFCNKFQTKENTVVLFKENYRFFAKTVGRAFLKHKFDKCFLVFFLDSEEEATEEGINPTYKFPKGIKVDDFGFPLYVILRSR